MKKRRVHAEETHLDMVGSEEEASNSILESFPNVFYDLQARCPPNYHRPHASSSDHHVLAYHGLLAKLFV